MFRLVSTLNDKTPYLRYFKEQCGKSSTWTPGKTHSVILLDSDVDKQGIEEAKKIAIVNPLDHITQQAKSNLEKQIHQQPDLHEGPPFSARISKKRKRSLEKTAKKVITKTTKDLLEREGRVPDKNKKRKR